MKYSAHLTVSKLTRFNYYQGRRKSLRSARFLLLGSASIDLLKQSSETLAGRIAYLESTQKVYDTDNKNFSSFIIESGARLLAHIYQKPCT